MVCTIHPNRQASSTCEICGQPYCEECLVEVNTKFYCKEHVSRLINPNPTPPNAYTHPYQTHNPHNTYNPGQHYAPRPTVNIYNAHHGTGYYGPIPGYYPYKNRVVALLLCIFLGWGGIHRFYVGKIASGLLYMFTGGFFGIGYVIDILQLIFGSFRDSNGLPLI